MARIARENGVSLSTLQAANKGVDPARLSPGQKLVIPGKASTSSKTAGVSTKSGKSASAPAPSAGRSTGASTHVVKSGDTVYRLSKEYKIPVGELIRLNGLSSSGALKAGQRLQLRSPAPTAAAPASSSVASTDDGRRRDSHTIPVKASGVTVQHVIAQGDTLSSLARRYSVSLSSIEKANPGLSPSRLRLGQQVTIPGAQSQNIPVPTKLVTRDDGRVLAPQPDPLGVNIADISRSLQGERPRTGYRVRRGDTVESVAREFLMSPGDLRALNRMGPMDRLHDGQYLIVPNYRNGSNAPARFGHTDA